MRIYFSILLMLFLSLPAPAARAEEFRSETDEHFFRDYWPSGNLRTQEPLVNGKRHGLAEYYHDNGQLYGKIPWVDGQKHGTFTLYRETGQVEQELSLKNGQPDGLNKWYYPNGKLYAAIHYKDGLQHGNGKWYNELGDLTDEAEYVDGQLTKTLRSHSSSQSEPTRARGFEEIIGIIVYLFALVVIPMIAGIRKKKKGATTAQPERGTTPPAADWLRTRPYEMLTLIRAAMIFGAFVLGAGAYFVAGKMTEPPLAEDRGILNYVLIGAVFLVIMIATKIREKVQLITQEDHSLRPVGAMPPGVLICTLTIVIFALGESLVIAGFVSSLLTGNFNYFLGMGAIGIALMMQMPDQETLARFQQGGMSA